MKPQHRGKTQRQSVRASEGEALFQFLPTRASLGTQLAKNPPARRETWVPSLGWEDAPEKEKATHSRILLWRTPWTIHVVANSRT